MSWSFSPFFGTNPSKGPSSVNENIEMNLESKIESYCNSVINRGINSVDSNVIHSLASKGGYVSTSTGGSPTEKEKEYAIRFCNNTYGGISSSASSSASSGRQYYEENNLSAAGYASSGALMSTGASATPKGARKRTMNNVRAGEEEATLLPATESFEDFKLRILNLAINAGDCYKDMTPAFTADGKEEDEFNNNTAETESTTTGTGAASTISAKPKKQALKADEKKTVFDYLIADMFDLTREVATKTLSTDPDAAAKDILKRKVITFFYKNGFPTRKKDEDPKTKPINDTNNVTTSIKNFVEENYFVCPKGRHFKYNLHMSEDDRHKFPELGIDGINIIYDAAGVLPQNIFLPGSYKIICTPGSYIDPGTKIKNETEKNNLEKSKGIIPNRNMPFKYSIDKAILRKYGLSDIIKSIEVIYDGLTKSGIPNDSVKFNFIINTNKADSLLDPALGESVKKINFNPTRIELGFNLTDFSISFPYQTFLDPKYKKPSYQYIDDKYLIYIYHPKDKISISKTHTEIEKRAKEYFKGNANKNKFIYENIIETETEGSYFRGEEDLKEQEKKIINNDLTTYIIRNEFIKYIIMKELGDTLQVLWLDVITNFNDLEDNPPFIGASDKPITKENTFVMTGDAMLISRCILNGYNCIYLTGASSTFYLSNMSIERLPFLSENLPELEPNPDDTISNRVFVSAKKKLGPKTPAALAVSTMVGEEPQLGFKEDPNPALNAYLTHNYSVINSLIVKGNAEPSVAGKNIWFYFAAYLKHHTDEMYNALKVSRADPETIGLFYFKELGEGVTEDGNYSFLNVGSKFEPIKEDVVAQAKDEKVYTCFKNTNPDVIWRKGFFTGAYSYFAGNYKVDELFKKISGRMTPEQKGQFYTKYYNRIIYPSELVMDITQINTIVDNFNTYNPLYKITEDDIIKATRNVVYFLTKLQNSSNEDISIEKEKIGLSHCYFEEEIGRTPRKRATIATPAKQGGGAFVYTARPADYEFEIYRPYFVNPGYATFYALSRFPRVFLMGYSILRFLREVFQAQTNEINTLFKFCEDALDPQLSKLLTEIFMHTDEPNYHYNVDSDEELEKQIRYMAELDTLMYYTIEVVRVVSGGTGLFATGNEILMGTIGGMLAEREPMSEKVIIPVILKMIDENRDIFVNVTTEFFRALIQNYNDLADVGKADIVNSISCYEHKIKNSVMSGVEEIMAPLDVLVRQKAAVDAYVKEEANVRMKAVPAVVETVVEPVTGENEGMVLETPPPERTNEGAALAKSIVIPADMSSYWMQNIPNNDIKKGIYNRKLTPRVSNIRTLPRAYSRRKSLGRSRFGRFNEEEPVLEGGAQTKTKKRTPLKHKRTRRKERK